MGQACHSNDLSFLQFLKKGIQTNQEMPNIVQNASTNLCLSSTVQIYSLFKREVIFWKTSSQHGIVRPPMG